MKVIIWILTSFVSICAGAYPISFESTPFVGSGLIRPNDTDKHTMILGRPFEQTQRLEAKLKKFGRSLEVTYFNDGTPPKASGI